jgi:hypothetical protein
MKIKLLVSRATATGAENRGDVIDVPDAEAIRMIDAEQAVAVRESAPERAVKPVKFERAVK